MNELILSGVELTLIGMGIVYLFLAMLVVVIISMARLLARYFPSVPIEIKTLNHKDNLSPQLIAAITAAVHQYRKKN
jgi:oxaloacetate decarboxylase gamma subunit